MHAPKTNSGNNYVLSPCSILSVKVSINTLRQQKTIGKQQQEQQHFGTPVKLIN